MIILFKAMRQLDFMGVRYYAYAVSLLLLVISLLSLGLKGLNLGLDFTGGTLLEVRYTPKQSTADIRKVLERSGVSAFQVQDTAQGTILVRLKVDEPRDKVLRALKTLGDYQLLRMESIGGVISGELRQKALWAILTAIGGILLYLAYRFEPVWALGAVLALAHDVFLVVGAYSLTGREVNLDVVAALLVVAGYSISDTVVVFDRIRENMRIRKGTDLKTVINISINQTLSRTVMTSLTTFVVSLTMFLLGGPVLSNIMFSFVVGIVVGTLSSIFVASALVLDIKERLVRPKLA
ncbi:protein-export membrane protein SecF [Thermocrinis albus DSM 14484]|uniref:Protein-export membrane protein SecF n=2 Tax=Thermocrinis TaxID=75905 RepID=D3SMD0_THEAH|nr:protein-export membrane protein SecF [Thermocrinis albus DSM 14484]